jgi:hypothetical protein
VARICPKCSRSISLAQVNSRFACPSCGARLTTSGPTVAFWAVAVWGFIASAIVGVLPLWVGVVGFSAGAVLVWIASLLAIEVRLSSDADAA